MSKISIDRIDKELKRLANTSGTTPIILTAKQREDVIGAFDIAMQEQHNKQKTELDQLKLLNSIASQIGLQGQDLDTAIAAQSAMRHGEYYDMFLKQGATSQILKALRENGIPYDVLKSVSNGVEMQREKVGKGVQITQEIEENANGTPHIVYFAIYKNGELIYEFVENRLDLEGEIEKAGGKYEYYRKKVKQPKNTKSVFAGTVKLSNGVVAKRWIRSDNSTFYTVGNRRVKA